MATIGLVAYWSMGEVGPFLQLGKALQKRGHRVILVSQGPYADMARKAGLEARTLDTPEQFAAYVADSELFNSPKGIQTLYQRHFLPLVKKEVELLESITTLEDSLLICRSTPGIAARLLSERDGCPLLPILPGMSHLHTWPLTEVFFRDVLSSFVADLRESMALPPRNDWEQWLQTPLQQGVFWPAWFDQPAPDCPLDINTLGFVRWQSEEEDRVPPLFQKLAAENRHPLLVSGGTTTLAGEIFFQNAIEAGRQLRRPVVLVTRKRAWLPESLPEDVFWFDRVPSLAACMKYSAVLLHHSGLWTGVEAMEAALPQLLCVGGTDRRLTASYFEKQGVGRIVEEGQWTPWKIASEVELLLSSTEVREACLHAQELCKDSDGVEKSCRWVEELLERPESAIVKAPVAPIPAPLSTEREEHPQGTGTSDKRAALLKRLQGLSPEKRALLEKRLLAKNTDSTTVEHKRDEAPLSSAQRGIWLAQEMTLDSHAYLISLAWSWPRTSSIQPSPVQKSLRLLLRRHGVFRTQFYADENKEIQQKLLPFDPLSFALKEERLQEEELASKLESWSNVPIDLQKPPLLEACWWETEERFVLGLKTHHLVMDGHSLQRFLDEFQQLYHAFSSGQSIELPALPWRYVDYIHWLQEEEQQKALQRGLSWWKERLAAPPVVGIPSNKVRDREVGTRNALVTRSFPSGLVQALEEQSQSLQVSRYQQLLALFHLTLFRVTGQRDLLNGLSVSNRDHSRVEGVVGLFLNTLAFRQQLEGEPSFETWVLHTQRELLQTLEYQYVPFERVVEAVQPEREAGKTPLFQVMFNYQSHAERPPLLAGIAGERLELPQPSSKFPLTLSFEERHGELQLLLDYNLDLLDEASVHRFGLRLEVLLTEAMQYPTKPVTQLSLLSSEERQQILYDWNATQQDYPDDLCVHHLFEQWVDKQPHALAVVGDTGSLTYRELEEQSNRLAHLLIEEGIGPDSLVGVCLERSLFLVVGWMAVLKAGGAFVPLDPAYPQERLGWMLEDAQASVLLTERSYVSRLPEFRGTLLCLDECEEELLRYSTTRLQTSVTPEHLVYQIYTSGSTGRPKGILLEHRGRVNNLTDMTRMAGLGAGDKVVGVSSPSFDICIYDTLGILGAGGTSLMTPAGEHADPALWAEWVHREKATLWHSAPALLLMLVEFVEQNPRYSLESLRVAILGGDWIPVSLPERLKALAPQVRFFALGGATEASIHSTAFEVESREPEWVSIPYGRPMANQQVYVLDPWKNPVPVGVEGELYLGGVGLARGYWNREPLTREKFVHCAGLGALHDRLYRTGDRVRFRSDGNLELLGRIDFQIKLRGHRIEPGEIEALLREHPAILEALVLLREEEPGQQQLVAYLLPSGEPEETGVIRTWLRSELPAYMVPSAFVWLESFPLNPNGKIDRRALPAPSEESSQSTTAHTWNSQQQEVAEVWSEFLGVPPESLEEHFFEQGGHSLLALRLLSRVEVRWGSKPTLREFFSNPLFGFLVDWIQEQEVEEERSLIPARQPQATVPLTYAQQRLWFLEQLSPEEATYHVPVALELRGEWNEKLWTEAWTLLVQRHEGLRSFVKVEGETASIGILAEVDVNTTLHDLSLLPDSLQKERLQQELEEALQRPFVLEEGPLFALHLWRLSSEHHVFLFNQHHLITDGWSVQLLLTELGECLTALAENATPSLTPVTVQYGDYAVWEQSPAQKEALSDSLEYWREKLAEPRAILELPSDYPRPRMQRTRGEVVSRLLSEELQQRVTLEARRLGVTRYMYLLAVWEILLHRLTGESDLCIGTPVAHRQHGSLESTAGFFVNTLVLREQVESHLSFSSLLAQVKETVTEAFSRQDVPFEQLVEELESRRDPAHHPLFQVMFSYDEEPLQRLELGSLDAKMLPVEMGTSKFDLNWSLGQREEGLLGVVEFNSDLFASSTIQRMLQQYELLLEAVLAAPEVSIAELPLLTEEEQRQILHEWNPPTSPLPAWNTVSEWFSSQAEQTPDALAVCYGELRMSYGELEQASNRVAHCLRQMGVQPEVCVGFLMERSLEMFVGLLGIWKAGGAYVPLHPETPRQRMLQHLEDTGATIFVTLETLADRMPEWEGEILFLDSETERLQQFSSEALEEERASSQLAYVLHTSGSTGKPKGVAIEHRQLLNFLTDMEERLGLGVEDHWLSVTALTFDISVLELCLPLLIGGTVTVIPWLEAMDGAALARRLDEGRFTWMQATPSVWRLLVEAGWSGCEGLGALSGGEALSLELAQALRARVSRLINVYGPTETTIWSTAWEVPDECQAAPLIGTPLNNTTCLVLDSSRRLLPAGIPGELAIGGAGVARGYIGREEETKRRFVDNPFVSEQRMYLTGDRVRWRADGMLEFLGRVDHQIKLRGFRIELGEIETALSVLEGVEEAVVQVVSEDGKDERLVAWLLSHSEQKPAEKDIRVALREVLPPYMIPTAFVWMEAWPLLSSGKIHRRGLPAPEVTQAGLLSEPPQGGVEEEIASFWSSLLEVERVGREDNFFELGGHSLLGMRLFSRIRSHFGVDVPLRLLFESPTVASLALAVEESRRQGRKRQMPTLRKRERKRQKVRRTSDGSITLVKDPEDS